MTGPPRTDCKPGFARNQLQEKCQEGFQLRGRLDRSTQMHVIQCHSEAMKGLDKLLENRQRP